jgi:hypothetical protein
MFKHLWSHCRNINVNVFQHKVVYDIPLYGDLVFKNFKVEYKNDSIILTTFREPVELHLKELSYDNHQIEMEQPGENDKYWLSRQQVCREMK